MRYRISWSLAAMVVGSAVLAGCAQDMGTLDRVQTNVVTKNDLLFNADGTRKEWYVRVTTVEAPYASAYSFQGDQGALERGTFDIQENFLYFYRSYTFYNGEYGEQARIDSDMYLTNKDGTPYFRTPEYSDDVCTKDKDCVNEDKDGYCNSGACVFGTKIFVEKNAPVLAYPISSHFDIIWEYNPNTGEKTNVRVENTSDRLWPDREYMRVSWGVNAMPSYAGQYFTWFRNENHSAVVEPAVFYDEGASPDVEYRITPAEGYMDVVTDWLATSPSEELEGYGTIPLCWYYPWYTGGLLECVSERIRTRTSFLAVDLENDKNYHPLQYTDQDMERFGFFRSERYSWDVDYGTAYSLVQRYVNAYDIFQRDDNDAIVGVRPIIYTVSEGYPDNLISEGLALSEDWSRAFDATVIGATGKAVTELPAYNSLGEPMLGADGQQIKVGQMFLLCENNRAEALGRNEGTALMDEAICGDLDEAKHLGDIRYNFLNASNAPTSTSLYGYGPPSADPISGRIISGNANMYVAAMRLGANRALNRIELLAGIKSFREIADADYIEQKVRLKRLKDSSFFDNGYTLEEAQAMVEKMVAPEVQDALTSTGLTKTDANFTSSRLARLSTSPSLEEFFVPEDVRMLFKDPSTLAGVTSTASVPDAYKLRNWSHASTVTEGIKKDMEMSKAGLDMGEFFDGALIRLANQFEVRYNEAVCGSITDDDKAAVAGVLDFDKYNASNPCSVEDLIEQMRVSIAYYNEMSPYGFEDTYIPTPLEMSSSSPKIIAAQKMLQEKLDALRSTLLDELQQTIFWGVAIHEVGHTVGLRHNFEASTDALNFGPEYWSLKVRNDGNKFVPVSLWSETAEQQAAGMREWQYTSVMDYYAKFNMPWQGLGRYDIAAIKYAYGHLIEVFNQTPDLTDFQAYIDIDPTKDYPTNVPAVKERGEGLGLTLRRIHSVEIPNLFDSIDAIYDRSDVPVSEILGTACDTVGATCGDGKVCKEFYEGLHCSLDKTVVPYRFGSDEIAYALPTVSVWDEGIEPFEIVQNLSELYENYWIWAGYWHNDPTFWPTDYDSWIRRMFYQLRTQYQWWVLNYTVYNHDDFWMKRFGKRWEQDLNGGLSGAMAAYKSFNVLAGAFGRPIPETYGFNKTTQRFEPVDEVNPLNYSTQITVLEEDGARPMYAEWNYDGYEPNVVSSGAIYERLAAFEMLADPEMCVLGMDYQADTRRYMVNFATVFKTEMRELFGGILANNSKNYGWCVLVHPTKGQPIGFESRDFVGTGYADMSCSEQYYGCFGDDSSATWKGIAYRYDSAEVTSFLNAGINPCETSGDKFLKFNGSSLEPEAMYTFPTTQYRIPMLAAYYGMSLLVNDYDRSFLDATRVWLKGSKYAVEPPVDAEMAECTDLFSGKTYVTYKMADGYYPAFDLIKQCDFVFSCFDPSRNGTLSTEDSKLCKAYAKGAKAVSELTLEDLQSNLLFHPLQFIVGKLELIRSMHATYEYGSPWTSEFIPGLGDY